MSRLLIAVFLVAGLVSGGSVYRTLSRDARSAGPLPVRRNGKWGYIDHTGKVVIPPRFESADFFMEGLAAIQVNSKWGFINSSGEVVIAPQFTSASRFSDGLAAVFIDGPTAAERTYGYVDPAGKLVIKCPAACGRSYSEGMMAEAIEIFRCVDEAGRTVPKEYPCAPDGASKSHAVMIDRWGYYDRTGKLAIPGIFHSGPGRFSEGVAAVQPYGASKMGFIDKAGTLVIAPQFDRAGNFAEGLAPAKVRDKWGFINHAGKFVIEPQFDSAGEFSDGFATVYLSGKTGYVARTGGIAIYPRFEEGGPFAEGLAAVCCENGKTGYIDSTGTFAIPAIFPPGTRDAGPFSEGIALVRVDGGSVYIDRSGKVIARVEDSPPVAAK